MQTPEIVDGDPDDATDNLDKALDQALAESAQLCFWRHKRLLQPIVVFKDGKVVHVPPEEIRLDPAIIDPETGKLR